MTFVSTLGQTIDQIERLKGLNLQIATLQAQLSSGKKARTFDGLQTDTLGSKRARADLKALETYDRNIDVAQRRLKMMTTIIQKIRVQAGNVTAAMQIQTQEGEYEIESVGQLADQTLDFINDLINERDGDRFLFGGADTLNNPFSDTGTLDTYVDTKVDDWINGTITTDQLISSYRDRSQLTDTIMGYSPELSTGQAKNVFARVDDNSEIDYTAFANEDAFRDIVAAAKVLGRVSAAIDKVALDPGDPLTTITAPGADSAEQNDNFFRMFNDLAAMINNALDKLDQVEYRLGNSQAQLKQISDNYRAEKNVLLGNISDVEDVDLNEVAVKITSLQTQIEASYRVTSFVQDLSLVNFLRF